MSKTVKIVIGVVAFFVVLAAFGAGKNSSDSPSKPSVTLVPNGSGEGSVVSREECASELSTLNGLMTQYAGLVSGITTASEIRQAIAAGRSIVQAGRSIVSECGHYAPTQAAAYSAALDQASASLDQLDGSIS